MIKRKMMKPILLLLVIFLANHVRSDESDTTEKPDDSDELETTEKPANVSDDGYDQSRFWGRRCPKRCPPQLPCPTCPICTACSACPINPKPKPEEGYVRTKDVCPFGGFVTCNCDMDCPDDEEFVCGSDGVTYQNDCFVKQASCESKKSITISRRGACRKNTRLSQCPESCAHVPTSTICNSDGYSLNNICQLKKDNCGQKTLKVYHRKNSICT